MYRKYLSISSLERILTKLFVSEFLIRALKILTGRAIILILYLLIGINNNESNLVKEAVGREGPFSNTFSKAHVHPINLILFTDARNLNEKRNP